MDRIPPLNHSNSEYSNTNDRGNPSLVEESNKSEVVSAETHDSVSSESLEEENSLLGCELGQNEDYSSEESEIYSRLVEEDSDGNFWTDSEESNLLIEEDTEEQEDSSNILNLEEVPVNFESSALSSEDSDNKDIEMSELVTASDSSSYAADSEISDCDLIENSESETIEKETGFACRSGGIGYQISAEMHNKTQFMELLPSGRDESNSHANAHSSDRGVLRDEVTSNIEETCSQFPVRQIGDGPSRRRRSLSDAQLVPTSSSHMPSFEQNTDSHQEDPSAIEQVSAAVIRAVPQPTHRRTFNDDDMFIKMLTPCDELRHMARDLHFKWISIDQAERQMKDIFDRAKTKLEFWRRRNVDCSHRALMQTCGQETILQIVYTLMHEDGNALGRSDANDFPFSVADIKSRRAFGGNNLPKNTSPGRKDDDANDFPFTMADIKSRRAFGGNNLPKNNSK